MRACAVLLVVIAGCGAATAPVVDEDASVAITRDATAVDAFAIDAAVFDATACETLVLTFVGCQPERLTECLREYAAVSAATRMIIDADAACFRSLYPQVGAARWPSDSQCSLSLEPPIFTLWSHWFHGGCQGDDAQVAMNVTRDPSFPACGTITSRPCFFGGTIPAGP